MESSATPNVEIYGAEVLDDVRDFIGRFCALGSKEALDAVVLWAAHTHATEHFHTTPRLAFLSPEPASGKTRALEVLEPLVFMPMFSLNASPPAIFRTLEDGQITLLFDEVDTIWSKRGQGDNHEDLRGLLNAGYKRGATIPRCVGSNHEVQHFEVFCSVALAGLGDLPDTIMSRAIIIRMRRRAPNEYVEPFRLRQHGPEGEELHDRLADWAEQVGERAGEMWPELPPGIVDRPAEVWEPLIALADLAGGEWPARARTACVTLCKVAEDRTVSLSVRLLQDLRVVFGDAESLSTADIIDGLVSGQGLEPDAPWAELYGHPITVRKLASMLKPYGISSTKIWAGDRALQGYRREHLYDAWVRYLPPLSTEAEGAEGAECSTASTPENGATLPDIPDIPDMGKGEASATPQVFDL